jgi:hypothetical protein
MGADAERLPGIPRSRVTQRPPAGEDLTGFEKDFLLVLGPTEEIRSDRRMWLCFCRRCGATFRRSKARIVEAIGACETCAREIRPPPACKVCRSPEHTAADCPRAPKRPRVQICSACGNLPHRRERPCCPRCRRPYQSEEDLRADGDRRDGDRQMLYGDGDPT